MNTFARICKRSAIVIGAALLASHSFASERSDVDGFYLEPTSYIVPKGSTGIIWNYTSTNPGASWTQSSFNDSTWNTSAAGFYDGGAEAGDQRTTPWPAGQSTLWLRGTFTLTANDIDNIMFWSRWDDNITIYINGIEATYANNWANSYRYLGMSDAARSSLTSGQNHIAVRVNDTGGGKYFDLGIVSEPKMANLPANGFTKNTQLNIFTDYMKETMSKYGVSAGALSVGVSSGEEAEILYSYGFGYMDKEFTRQVKEDAVFRVASLDKAIAGDAIQQMVTDGVINPATNTPITYNTQVFPMLAARGLTPLPGATVDARADTITLRNILDHRAWFPDNLPNGSTTYYNQVGKTADTFDAGDHVRWLYSQPLRNDPGAAPGPNQSSYTNSGFTLLRHTIDVVNGGILEYLRAGLFVKDPSIFISHERLEGRAKYADSTLREPWYNTFENSSDRWVHLEDELGLASSTSAYALFRQTKHNDTTHNTKGIRFYGGFAGTVSVVYAFEPIPGTMVTYAAFFNNNRLPMNEWNDNGIAKSLFDGDLETLMQTLPADAWVDSSLSQNGCQADEWTTNGAYSINWGTTPVTRSIVSYQQHEYELAWGNGSATPTTSSMWTDLGACDVTTPNQNPTVSINAPLNSAQYEEGADIVINALANDTDGSIASVEFFNGSTSLGTVTTTPFTVTLTNATTGNYVLTALATDNEGAQTTSATSTVTVSSMINQLPVVSIDSPTASNNFTAGDTIMIRASASDNDGSITKVAFYQGNIKLGETTALPYTYSWNSVAAGSYNLSVIATDDQGAETTSAAIGITVSGQSSGCQYPEWDNQTSYTAGWDNSCGCNVGEKVYHNGRAYEAKWNTPVGIAPDQPQHWGAWADLGVCE